MDLPSAIRPFASASAIYATVVAFASAPLLRFMDPAATFALGYGIAVGAAGLVLTSAMFKSRWPAAVCALILAGSATGLFLYSNEAIDAAAANDRRCERLQKDMLSPSPRLRNGTDLFQALGCRPQGRGDVEALLLPPSQKDPTSPSQ